MTAPKVLVTGATGLVGEALVFRLLLDKRFAPIATARGATRLHGLCDVVSFELTGGQRLAALDQVQVVVHAAARVHVMNEIAADALAEFRRINVQGTLDLARQAAKAGVKRFIFISSIKVNGEHTPLGKPFRADDKPCPNDPYAVSKWEAEQALRQLGDATGMEIVIIRPPLVYGPGVKANFLSMLNWLERGVPLPLGAIKNQRSLVFLGNLVDLMVTCIDHPAATDQTFLVSDGDDVSTTRLLKKLALALGKRPRLLPLPQWLLKLCACMLGKRNVASRVLGSLQIDISKNQQLLGWRPPVNLVRAMRQTADHYRENLNK
ncbi:NAD-dependent epimerase/dehydratase family protein [Pseudomonas sp. MWU12-2115]|uniref:UDP-glucose 4-epimerase family protein n=1 Tax=unclassified Pseudomonas TaxID=196821 RepID=UPI000CD4B4CA|nr:SDR family oxidoreductase [Pseudomonas sp. MWU12-2020]RBC03494.1 NAD-dependent epimerase/dehydratase family protein [Pseudomonas sp. MWU12-2115]